MLFQVHHVHTKETCPAAHADVRFLVAQWWTALKSNPEVSVISCYVSPSDHTFYITLDANDSRALAKALGPINALGIGNTSPVLPLDEVLAMAEAGEFS